MVVRKIFHSSSLSAIGALVMLWLIGAGSLFGRELDWHSWTSFRDIRRLTPVGDSMYVASSGGLMIVTDPEQAGSQYTNVDGLNTNDIRDVISDAEGQVWLAGQGRLIKFDGSNPRSYLFRDADDKMVELYTIADDDDYLWIGTDLGLVLFSKSTFGGQIEDSYGRFGDLSDFPAVYDILIEGDTIWLATSAGLAVADMSDPRQLKNRANWISMGSELFGIGLFNCLARFESDLYLGSSKGLQRLTISNGDMTAATVPVNTNAAFTSLSVENDSLFYYSTRGMGVIVGGVATSMSTAEAPSPPSTGTSFGGQRWIAVQSGGLYYGQPGDYREYAFSGLPNDRVSDLTVNEDGIISAAFGSESMARYIDGSWNTIDFWVRFSTLGMMTDRDGNPYTATFGNGLWVWRHDSLANYDENNSTMRGNSDDPPNGLNYVVVKGLATGGRYIFAACYRAVNGYPIAIGDLDHLDDPVVGWDSMGVGDGITTDRVVGLDWSGGQLAIGSESQGLYLCDVGDDPFNRPNSVCQHFTIDNSHLRSDIVNVVRFAPDGTLWAGTSTGLSRYDIGIERFVDVDLPAGIDRSVVDMEFDGRGNLWVGTTSGLARYDAASGTFDVYTTQNSGLVADEINGVTLDQWTGRTYVSTENGISWISSLYGDPETNIEEVLAFPNPFVITSDDDFLSFNFARRGRVRLFTVAGEVVRELDVNDRWYGRNESGREVASGVYLFTVIDSDGNVGRGKVLLVRQ